MPGFCFQNKVWQFTISIRSNNNINELISFNQFLLHVLPVFYRGLHMIFYCCRIGIEV